MSIFRFVPGVLGELSRSFNAAANRPSPHRFEPEPIRFVDTQTNLTVPEGEMATLNCSIENLGTKKVSCMDYFRNQSMN